MRIRHDGCPNCGKPKTFEAGLCKPCSVARRRPADDENRGRVRAQNRVQDRKRHEPCPGCGKSKTLRAKRCQKCAAVARTMPDDQRREHIRASAKKNRRNQRLKQERQGFKSIPHFVDPKPPAEDVAARMAEIPQYDLRDITGVLMGDPLFERSALAKGSRSNA